MSEGIVSPKIIKHTVTLTSNPDEVWIQVQRMANQEPALYAGLCGALEKLTSFFLNNGGSQLAAEEFESLIETMAIRVYLAMKLGAVFLWSDVFEMREALDTKWGKIPNQKNDPSKPKGEEDKGEAGETSAGESWL